jgi:hypothetical protein
LALACNPGNSLRTPRSPLPVKEWPLRSLKKKRIETGAKAVSQGRHAAFKMAEAAAIPRTLFAHIPRLIAELRPPPAAVLT